MKKWNTVCISILLINIISFTLNQSLFDNLDQSAATPPAQITSQPQLNPGTPEPILQPKMTTTATAPINDAPEDQVSFLYKITKKTKLY
jgi:hypothetical protein